MSLLSNCAAPAMAKEPAERAAQEGRPGAAHPPKPTPVHTHAPLHTHTHSHAYKLTFLPSVSLSLSSQSWSSLFLSPHRSALSSSPFYYLLTQPLFLWVSFDFCSPFLSPSLFTCLSPQPSPYPSNTRPAPCPTQLYLLYRIFPVPFLRLPMLRYTNTIVTMAYGTQQSDCCTGV